MKKAAVSKRPVRHSDSSHHFFSSRDPLNLTSVKPDNPLDPCFIKPLELIVPKNASDPLNLLDESKNGSISRSGKR